MKNVNFIKLHFLICFCMSFSISVVFLAGEDVEIAGVVCGIMTCHKALDSIHLTGFV